MAKKQAVSTKTKAAAAAPAAKPVASSTSVKTTAKPRTPRVSSAKHSKPAPAAEGIPAEAAGAPALEIAPAVPVIPARVENSHAAIAKIAYGYWAARGFQGGNPLEDWVRAERQYNAQK